MVFRCDFFGSVTVFKLFDFFVLFLQFNCEFLGNSNIKVTCMYVANLYFFLAFTNLSLQICHYISRVNLWKHLLVLQSRN